MRMGYEYRLVSLIEELLRACFPAPPPHPHPRVYHILIVRYLFAFVEGECWTVSLPGRRWYLTIKMCLRRSLVSFGVCCSVTWWSMVGVCAVDLDSEPMSTIIKAGQRAEIENKVLGDGMDWVGWFFPLLLSPKMCTVGKWIGAKSLLGLFLGEGAHCESPASLGIQTEESFKTGRADLLGWGSLLKILLISWWCLPRSFVQDWVLPMLRFSSLPFENWYSIPSAELKYSSVPSWNTGSRFFTGEK